MLVSRERSFLLVVDVQERLLPAVEQPEQIEKAVCELIQIANQLGVPCLYSEQYPKGLGRTSAAVLEALGPSAPRIEKLSFSCLGEPAAAQQLGEVDRPQAVICGMETHVCVLQTAMDLKAQGWEVYVVADAVSSRTQANKTLALERMRQEGIRIISAEMVIFEWMERAGTDDFRSISREYLR